MGEEIKEETTEAPKVETTSMIDKANEAAERLEKANKEQAELIARQEEIVARQTLGGSSEAAGTQTAPKEETPKDYAKRVMSGEAGNV